MNEARGGPRPPYRDASDGLLLLARGFEGQGEGFADTASESSRDVLPDGFIGGIDHGDGALVRRDLV
jgi:hypothetical protein